MKRKALSFLLILCLIIGMVPVAALADSDPVVEVNGQQFSDLETAMSQIQTICDAGKTASVKLLGDASWNTEQSLSIPEGYTVTLDLAGHAVSGSTTGPLLVNYGNLTIEDSTAGEDSHGIGQGRIYTTNLEAQGRHAVQNYGTLTINGGIFGDNNTNTTDANDQAQRGNALRNLGTAIINGGAFTACDNYVNNGYAYAIANGDSNHPDASLTIHYATVYGSMNGALASDGGVVTVEDGSYTLGKGSEDSLYYVAYTSGNGQIVLKGGSYTRNVNNSTAFFSDYSDTGAGIVVQGGTYENAAEGKTIAVGNGVVAISGGNFKDDLSASASATITITGGTFTGDVSKFIQDGYELSEGTVQTSSTRVFASGTGSAEDPYVINTVEQFKAFRKTVNDKTNPKSYAGQYIRLDANLTLDEENWEPIGNGTRSGSSFKGNSFRGVFDGNGMKISGLKITDAATNADDAIGLFGVLNGGTVQDLTLTDVQIDVTNGECVGGAIGLMVNGSTASGITVGTENGNDTITAVRGLGGIVGRMTISGGIIDCVNYATIKGTSEKSGNVGGIVGAAYYTNTNSWMIISGCKNYGSVSNKCMGVGGIVGLSAANVENCENTGEINGNGTSIGGIVGEQQNAGYVIGCTNTAKITNTSTDFGTGGIIGWLRYNGADSDYKRKEVVEVSNNFNSGDVIGGTSAGGIVGHLYNAGKITGNENTASEISSSNFQAGIVGSIQNEDKNSFAGEKNDIDVSNNVSTTTNFSGTGGCKNDYAYNNLTNSPEIVSDNGREWVAQIEGKDGKYTTLQLAIENAETGDTVTVLKNVELTGSLSVANKQDLTLQGATSDVTISCADTLTTKAVFTGTPSGTFTLKDLTFDDAVVTISGMNSAMNVVNCTFQNLDYPTNTKLGAINFTQAKNGSSLNVTDCVFTNLNKHADSAEVVGIYTQQASDNSIDSVTVTGSSFTKIQGTALSLRGTPKITVTKNTFENWAAADSGTNDGRALRADFSGQATQTLVFNENKLIAGTGAHESYAKVDHVGESTDAIDVDKNYWNGKDPITGEVQMGTPVLEILMEGEKDSLTPDELKDSTVVKGQNQYYTAETMRPQDLNTYVPSTSPSEPNEFPFVDVSKNSWYYDAVKYVYENGIMAGTGDTTFAPEMLLTRAQAVQMLYNLEGKPQVTGESGFSDLAQGAYYLDAVTWASQNKVVAGMGDGTFQPDTQVSREQFAQMLYNFAQFKGYDLTSTGDLTQFPDAGKISSWAQTAMGWANGNGLINGHDTGAIDPQGTATRAQAASILMNFDKNIVK